MCCGSGHAHEHTKAVKRLKEILSREPVLNVRSGLGVYLLQDDHPIAYTSRYLTQAENQIEKELLAVVVAYTSY